MRTIDYENTNNFSHYQNQDSNQINNQNLNLNLSWNQNLNLSRIKTLTFHGIKALTLTLTFRGLLITHLLGLARTMKVLKKQNLFVTSGSIFNTTSTPLLKKNATIA